MYPNRKIINIDRKFLLSTLWIIVMINMLKADVLSLHIPDSVEEALVTAGGQPITMLMLGGTVMMENSIFMIILSRVMQNKFNRWVNIFARIITILFVVGSRASIPHYIFKAAVKVIGLLLILWFTWKWN